MSFDKNSRYMSKIHVILVVLSMYFFKTVSSLNQIYFHNKIYQSQFSDISLFTN